MLRSDVVKAVARTIFENCQRCILITILMSPLSIILGWGEEHIQFLFSSSLVDFLIIENLMTRNKLGTLIEGSSLMIK